MRRNLCGGQVIARGGTMLVWPGTTGKANLTVT
jgi:hypothetical protein